MSYRAIVYTRVSSLAQSREDKISLDEQTEECLRYATDNGYEVVEVVREVHSAATVSERPLLLDAMRRIKDGEADVLLAYCLDRLTRQQSGIYTIDETIRPRGRIEFVTEEFEDTAIGRFTRSAKAFVAESERHGSAGQVSAGSPACERQCEIRLPLCRGEEGALRSRSGTSSNHSAHLRRLRGR